MKLILMSAPNERANEVSILNDLFEAGLEYYHLRKPDWEENDIRKLIEQIDPKHYQNIVIHYHFELQQEYKFKGIHLGEQQRWDMEEELDDLFVKYDYVSSSVHEPATLGKLKRPFQYIFCSPVFPSISKPGYVPKHDWNVKKLLIPLGSHSILNRTLSVAEGSTTKGKAGNVTAKEDWNIELIGLGGVKAENVEQVKAKGFQGVGVLGKVWNSENPVERFVKIKAICGKIHAEN